MEKVLKSKAVVRFQDCDPYNHLNNAKYIDYLVNAREDQVLAYYDLDVYARARKEGKAWVVAANQIAYLSPAFTMETVLIESQVLGYSPKSIQVESRMWNEDQTKLKAFLWVSLVHFDLRSQTVVPHDAYLMELFAKVLNPLPEKSFEERLATFRRQPTGVSE